MRVLVACNHCLAQYDVSGRAVGESLTCACGATMTVPQPRVTDARIVRCASCGASRNKGGDNCEFCGARFSMADKGWGSMCPRCFVRLPNDANYCVECGVKINPQPLQQERPDLPCPRCKVPMRPRRLDQISVIECGSCAGLWLPVETFDSICNNKEAQSIATRGLSKGRKNVFELAENEVVKYIPCPKCKTLMNRRNFARVSGVIIDTCRDCGVWLDNQELGRILQFIQSGGMERTREIEQREREQAARSRLTGTTSLSIGGTADAPIFSLKTNHYSNHVGNDVMSAVLKGVVRGVIGSFFR